MLKKNIIANYIGQFYLIVIGIIMLPFYLEYLGAEAYGLVGFFALMQSWMVLLDMGISPTLSREVARVRGNSNLEEKQKFIKLLHSLEFLFLIVAGAIVLGAFIFSDLIANSWLNAQSLDSDTLIYCISMMGLMIGIRFVVTLYNSGISGAEAQVWQNKANIIIQTLKFVGVLVVLKFISTDIQHFFEYQLVIAIVEIIVFSRKFYMIMEIEKFKLYFSYEIIKPHIPFALGIAYTGGIWVLMTQFDKLLLSGILTLKEYGYFAIIAMVANAIIQISNPISKAILPRMTSLLSQGKEQEMISVYKKATQFMAIFVFSVVGVVGIFSYELLFSWTGNMKASKWGADILFWYVLGNGILAVSAFQYYLQFAHGKLKMHVQYNTIFALISIPTIYFVAYQYEAIGVAIAWFTFRLLSFFIWVPIVHHKFAPGIHKSWMLHDVLPIAVSTMLCLGLIKYIDFNFDMSRIWIFISLLGIGLAVLSLNVIVASESRKMILSL